MASGPGKRSGESGGLNAVCLAVALPPCDSQHPLGGLGLRLSLMGLLAAGSFWKPTILRVQSFNKLGAQGGVCVAFLRWADGRRAWTGEAVEVERKDGEHG